MSSRCDLAVLVTCHNRAVSTVRALQALYANRGAARLCVYLVDDGCSDDTRAQVASAFPEVRILSGDGSLYWGGGMALAFDTAMRAGHDFYLWLNDDTELAPDAVRRLLALHAELKARRGAECIIVGATCDPRSGHLSYGAVRRASRLPLLFEVAQPAVQAQRCVTFHGNCVLIPDPVARAVGSIDGAFRHYLGDIDYGLRASRSGYEVWLLPRFAGTCARDPAVRSVPDLPRALAALRTPKGLRLPDATLVPFAEWWRFARRHGGALRLLYFLWPYRRLLRCLAPRRAARS